MPCLLPPTVLEEWFKRLVGPLPLGAHIHHLLIQGTPVRLKWSDDPGRRPDLVDHATLHLGHDNAKILVVRQPGKLLIAGCAAEEDEQGLLLSLPLVDKIPFYK